MGASGRGFFREIGGLLRTFKYCLFLFRLPMYDVRLGGCGRLLWPTLQRKSVHVGDGFACPCYM